MGRIFRQHDQEELPVCPCTKGATVPQALPFLALLS